MIVHVLADKEGPNQSVLGLRCPHMLTDTLSQGTAHTYIHIIKQDVPAVYP